MPETNNFQWELYLRRYADRRGTKYRDENSNGRWVTDPDTIKRVTESELLLGLLRIADVDPSERSRVHEYIKADDESLDSISGMSCRVWVQRALERLRIEGDIGFERWEILEQETLMFGNMNLIRVKRSVQSRALGYSKVCGLTPNWQESFAYGVAVWRLTTDDRRCRILAGFWQDLCTREIIKTLRVVKLLPWLSSG